MRRTDIERLSIALRSSSAPPEAVLDAVLPGVCSEPNLVRTRALEVAVEAGLKEPDQADSVGAKLRDALESGPPLTTREIELLLPIARERPRALADCIQPLFDVLAETDKYDDSSGLIDGDSIDRRHVAATTVLVAAVEKAPGLFQGAVPMLLELAGTGSVVERRCLWAFARCWDVEPAIVRPTVAGAVWTIEDESGEEQRQALDRLSTIGRIRPDALPSGAVSAVASVATEGQPKSRAHAFCTLATIGGRPSDAFRRHALDFDDTDGLFLGNRPALTKRLVNEDATAQGQVAPEIIAPHRGVIIDALQAEDPAVARAAQDAAIILGRESPAWLRAHVDVINSLVTAESSLDRGAAASLIQRSIPGAPTTFLSRAFTWLRQLVGDDEKLVCQRTIAALRTLLSELLGREQSTESGSFSASDVWGTLLGRYLTGSGGVRDAIADILKTIDVDSLPPGAMELATGGLLSRADRIGAATALVESDDSLDVVREADEDWSVDRDAFIDLLEFAARLLDQSDRTDERLAKAIVVCLETADSDHEQLFDIIATAESSLRQASVSVSEILETAYCSPETFGVEDLRQESLDVVPSFETIDPSVFAGIVESATIDIINEETPYWTEAAASRALEAILLDHPRIAECARKKLLETLQTAGDERRGITARLVATAFLAAPPRDLSEVGELATMLESVNDDPAVETWLAVTLLILSPGESARSQAIERLRSLRVRGDLDTFGTALGVLCAAIGSLPSAVTEPLVTREPGALFDALERVSVAPRVQQPALDRIFQRVTVTSDPAARAGLGSVLAPPQMANRSSLVSVIRQERVLWFLTGDNLRLALRCLASEEPDDGYLTGGYQPAVGYQSALSALMTHPDTEVRDLATKLRETDSRTPASADLEVRSAYRLQPPDTGVERNESSIFDGTGALSQGDSIERQDKLVQAVRHGGPEPTLAGLEAIQRGIDRGTVDWAKIGSTIIDHLTDRWRIVRQTAARVLLHATWAGMTKPDRSFLADRLVKDEATRGVLIQVLVATDPDEWPAPMRIAPVLLDCLVSDEPYSERHAAGQALITLARSSPDTLRETIADGVERLADGEGDALVAYHLLAAFDRLVAEHGSLADDLSGYLDMVLTSDSFAGIPSRDDGRTVSPVTPEATPPVNRLSVYKIAVSLAAHGGLRAYRGILDPPSPLETGDILTAEGVESFLRNASNDAVQDIGLDILESLSQKELTEIVNKWLGAEHDQSPALAARRVAVIPLLARAADGTVVGTTTERPRYVDTVVEALSARDSEVRVEAVEALSQLTGLGYCPPDELTAHLLGRTADPSGWVRRSTVEALAKHAPIGNLTDDWLYRWARRELAKPRGLQARTAAMLLGELGVKEPSLRRQCLETAADAFPSGRQQLNDRLASTMRRLLESSSVLEKTLDDAVLARLNETDDDRVSS